MAPHNGEKKCLPKLKLKFFQNIKEEKKIILMHRNSNNKMDNQLEAENHLF